MRLGLFGGTFDPVHTGHLILAECCRQQAALDEVWFVPASIPPHKQGRQLASDACRLEMLQLAVSGNDAFRVSSMELQRGGVSYTVDTLSAVHSQQPQATLFFLMGADSLHEFATWRQPERICQLATPLIVRRGGAPAPDLDLLAPFVAPPRLEEIRGAQFAMPAIEISSSGIRSDVSAGRSIRYRTPRAVEQYIRERELYRGPSRETQPGS